MAADGMTPWLAPGCRRPWVVGRHGGPANYDGVFVLRRPGPYLGKWITEDSCGGLTMTSRTLERLHWRTNCRRTSPSASAALVKTAVCRNWPGETGLFGHSRACLEVGPKVYASVFVLQAFRRRRVFYILIS